MLASVKAPGSVDDFDGVEVVVAGCFVELLLHFLKVTTGDDLTACTGFKVDYYWRFQIECKTCAVLSDDDDDLRLTNVIYAERSQLTSRNTHLIVRDKSPWAHNS